MISQGASKVILDLWHKMKNENRNFSYDLKKKKFLLNLQVNISLVVNDNEAEECVRALHTEFF